MIPRGRLNVLLTIEREKADDAFDGAGQEVWRPIGKVWAEVQDVLPSRGERDESGFTDTTWRARVRTDRRSDITSAMRFVGRGRAMEIVSGPALVENPRCVEFVVEEFGTKAS